MVNIRAVLKRISNTGDEAQQEMSRNLLRMLDDEERAVTMALNHVLETSTRVSEIKAAFDILDEIRVNPVRSPNQFVSRRLEVRVKGHVRRAR